MLAWRSRYDLDAALGETIAWYRDYFSSRDAETLRNRRIKAA